MFRSRLGVILVGVVATGMVVAGGTLASLAVSSGPRNVFVPITPCRLFDTRPEFQGGERGTPLGAGETMVVAAHGSHGRCAGIPADAVGISMNVTALGASAPTFLTIWAHGASWPESSSLNPVPGEPPTPNGVTTQLSADGGSRSRLSRG